jgi:hypothetical protein
MTPQLNYLVVQQRHIELTCRAEHARLANEVRRAELASLPCWKIGRLLAPRRLRAARLAAPAAQASPAPAPECLRCGT